jgi:hypothetical protein
LKINGEWRVSLNSNSILVSSDIAELIELLNDQGGTLPGQQETGPG